MVTIEQLRKYMSRMAEEDRQKKTLQLTGYNLEDTLKEASLELGLPVSQLEYEVLEKGSKGFAGLRKKKWILIVSERTKKKSLSDFVEAETFDAGLDMDMEPEVEDKDGDVCVTLRSDGAYVKVYPPKGEGEPAAFDDALMAVKNRAVTDIDEEMLSTVVEDADGEWVRIGDFIYNPASDAIMTVEVSDDEMKAFIRVNPAGPGGADLSEEDITNFLKTNGVMFGIDEEKVQAFVDHPVYQQAVHVADGTPPKHGKDAEIHYEFETDPNQVHLKENQDGRVDFKELNLIQNVVKDEVLARKSPPEPGEDGKTVTGQYLPARDGKDVEMGLGKNVTVADNGSVVKAAASGQVLLMAGKITVETVLVIPGDVSSATGNVSGLGAVIVKGNVEDGFSVTAQANIEVHGYVGKANLEAGGDVVVHQGINGGGEGLENFGKVKSGKSVWTKFITNAHIEAGDSVMVSDGIVNSEVVANRRILCKGQRAKIVGGHLRAAEEINAATLGSRGGAETVLEVGYDPETKEQIEAYEMQQEELEKKFNDIDINLQGLIMQKKRKKKLSKERERHLLRLEKEHAGLKGQLDEIKEEIAKRQEYLATLKEKGKVSAASTVFPGVTIYIKEVFIEVNSSYGATTFVQEGGLIKTTAYEEIDDEDMRLK